MATSIDNKLKKTKKNNEKIDLLDILSLYSNTIYYGNKPILKKKISKVNSIDCLTPPHMSSVLDSAPEISIIFNYELDIDVNKLKMYLDNEIIKPNFNTNKIYYIPKNNLSYGTHYVKTCGVDNKGESIDIKWSFIIENPDIEYNFYYGIPHAHTCYSDGKGTPLDAFEYSKKRGLDFLILADHSNFLDGVKVKNYEYDKVTNQYVEKENSQWYKTRKEAEIINNKYVDFIALRGFEMSTASWGHINVINSNNYVEGKRQIRSMQEFFNWIKLQKNIVVSINHPGRSFKRICYIPEMDGIINLIEVGNGAFPRKYRRTEKYYFDALDLGWHFGAINGQDNHSDNWGDDDNLTVILAQELSRNSLIDAFKKRRTYSTETKTLKLIFKANDYWMGSIISLQKDNILSFDIVAEDTSIPIERIQIITNKGKVLCEEIYNNVHIANWKQNIRPNIGDTWYVVKVIHANGKWGISSPIFVKCN
jgi:hypothetical protein